jgi:integrase
VDAAGTATGGHSIRDHALAALHRFSGLRPEEVVRLCWENLDTELAAGGRYGLTAAVVRGGRTTKLLLPTPASDAIKALARESGGTVESLSGPILCARGRPG